VEEYLKRGGTIHDVDNSEYTLMHDAAARLELDAIRWLQRKGAKLNEQENYGNTPLHLCVESAIENHIGSGYPSGYKVCQYLVKQGADITLRNDDGRTAKDQFDSYGGKAEWNKEIKLIFGR